MSKYLLIQPSEDGEPCTFLNDIQDVLDNPEDYGIHNFLSSIPENDPMSWPDGDALLLMVEILKPKVKATAFRLDD